MDEIEKSVEFFGKGYSCSQSILAGFGPNWGLDQETAVRLGRAFGAGIGQGALCGAVSGSYLILGLQKGLFEDEKKAREETYELVRRFNSGFEALRTSVVCRDLLNGVDVGTKEGLAQARAEGLFTTICPGVVRDAARVLKGLID